MTARVSLYLQTDKHVDPDDVRWAVGQALDQINSYIDTNASWRVYWRDYVYVPGRGYVNGYNDLRGRIYLSSHYIRTKVSVYKGCLHEMSHSWYPYHHTSYGMLGRGGVKIYTFTPRDFAVMRPRRIAGSPDPWEDPRNLPDLTADTAIVEPSSRTVINVIENDRQARGWSINLTGVPEVVEGTGSCHRYGHDHIVFFAPDNFEHAKIKYEVRSEMGSDSQAIGSLDIVATPEQFRWTNPDNKYDVNDDGRVSALDALITINHQGPVDESEPALDDNGNRIYPDVNDDDRVSSLDALQVINELSRNR